MDLQSANQQASWGHAKNLASGDHKESLCGRFEVEVEEKVEEGVWGVERAPTRLRRSDIK